MMTEIVIGSEWRTRCRASFSHHSEARRTKNVRLAFSFVAALPDTLLAILQAETNLRCGFLGFNEHEIHDNSDSDPEEHLLMPKQDFAILKEAQG
jgi:hypothetical protein